MREMLMTEVAKGGTLKLAHSGAEACKVRDFLQRPGCGRTGDDEQEAGE